MRGLRCAAAALRRCPAVLPGLSSLAAGLAAALHSGSDRACRTPVAQDAGSAAAPPSSLSRQAFLTAASPKLSWLGALRAAGQHALRLADSRLQDCQACHLTT